MDDQPKRTSDAASGEHPGTSAILLQLGGWFGMPPMIAIAQRGKKGAVARFVIPGLS
jgi:hypothetical protein